MGTHLSSLEKSILTRIQDAGPGQVFTPNDFLDAGTRAGVDQALSRQARRGFLQRFARGLYGLPRLHRIWGSIPPSPEAVMAALARRDGLRVVPTRLGARPGSGDLYLTDGRSRQVRIGKSVITLRHAAARKLALASLPCGDILLALLDLSRPEAEAAARERLPGLDPDRKAALRAARRLTPAWLSDLLEEHGC